MKVLSIGNSFSHDAHQWLHQLALSNDFDMELYNLVIGGCSLERHWNNVLGNIPDYNFMRNGENISQGMTLYEGLRMEEFDVVTIQQVSHYSGRPQTYFPYLPNLMSVIRQLQPKARVYFQQTWAYEIDSTHGRYGYYNHDQKEMFRRIVDATEMASKVAGIPLIPTGTVIQKLRETVPEFDYPNGGLSLNRDGFHLSLDYGRYAAAATWFHTLTGRKIEVNPFEDFDLSLLEKIVAVVEEKEEETQA